MISPKIKIYLILLIPFLLAGIPAQAQEGLKKRFQGRDLLGTTLNQLDQMKNKPGDTVKKAPDIADDLSNLPNPFLSKLPFEDIAEPPEKPSQRSPVPGPRPGSRPAGAQVSEPETTFKLSGLIWHTDLPQAIVNGEVIKEGDHIDLWTVKKITKQGVEMIYNDQTLMIKP